MKTRLVLFLLTAVVVSTATADIRIGTWNVEWLYDHKNSKTGVTLEKEMNAPSKKEYFQRIDSFAEAINKLNPDFLALQEIEGRHILKALAGALRSGYGKRYRYAFIEGTDTHTGQDVGLLIREGWNHQQKRFRFDRNSNPRGRNLSKHLRVDLSRGNERFTVVIVHLLTDQKKRLQQAYTLRSWLDELDRKQLVVLGDFNTKARFSQTSKGSDVGVIRGFKTASANDDLYDAHQKLGKRATHVSGRQLDRILLSRPLWKRLDRVWVSPKLAVKGNEDRGRKVLYSEPVSTQDLSDHYPLMIQLK